MRSALGVLLSLFPATELSACKQEVYFNFQSHGRGKLISLVCCLSARILPLTNSKSIQRNHGSYIGQLIFSIIDSPRLLAGLLTDARFCGMVCGALRYNSGVRLVIEQPRYCKRGGMRSSRESISHSQRSCIANRRKNGVLQRLYTSVPIATLKEFCPSQQQKF